MCFPYFDAWLFYPSEGVKSQLKFFCLRQKNHLKPFLKVWNWKTFSSPNHNGRHFFHCLILGFSPPPPPKNLVPSKKIRWGRGWLLLVPCFGKSSIVLKISGGILSRTCHPSSGVLNWIRVIFWKIPMQSIVLKFYLRLKKIILLFFELADEEKIYHLDGPKKFFVLLLRICKTFIMRPYSPPVIFFDEVAS